MLPAHQRFDPRHHPRGQHDHRLIDQGELAPLHRPLEVGLQLQALQDGGVHGPFEHLIAALAAGLRGVHRHVGVPEQLLGSLDPFAVVVADGDAQAGPHEHLLVLQVEGLLERPEDPLGHLGRPVVSGVLEQHPELVSP